MPDVVWADFGANRNLRLDQDRAAAMAKILRALAEAVAEPVRYEPQGPPF